MIGYRPYTEDERESIQKRIRAAEDRVLHWQRNIQDLKDELDQGRWGSDPATLFRVSLPKPHCYVCKHGCAVLRSCAFGKYGSVCSSYVHFSVHKKEVQ